MVLDEYGIPIESSSGEYSDSEEEEEKEIKPKGVESLIEIENPNRAGKERAIGDLTRKQRLVSCKTVWLVGLFADVERERLSGLGCWQKCRHILLARSIPRTLPYSFLMIVVHRASAGKKSRKQKPRAGMKSSTRQGRRRKHREASRLPMRVCCCSIAPICNG